jgi:transcriptional regulator with XRE-family HTH domain
MKVGAPGAFGAQLKVLREAAGFTQEELATIAGLSVHAVSALERGERRRPHVETVRALSAALDLSGATRDGLLASARAPAPQMGVGQPRDVSLPLALTGLLGRDGEMALGVDAAALDLPRRARAGRRSAQSRLKAGSGESSRL